MPAAQWLRVPDPSGYARRVLGLEAPDIPAALLEPAWSQQTVLLDRLSVDEDLVASHDAQPFHGERRDRFIRRIVEGQPLPPLVALGRA